MHSQPVRSEANRRRAEGQFQSKKKPDPQNPQADNNAIRQAEAEKTARLRALRLAKGAADRDAAAREAAAALALKPQPRRRVPRARGSESTERVRCFIASSRTKRPQGVVPRLCLANERLNPPRARSMSRDRRRRQPPR